MTQQQQGGRPQLDTGLEPDEHLGRLVAGRYRIEAQLGRGGMGQVYRAVQEPLGRAIALKMLPAYVRDPALQRRFLLEASVTGRLTHPNTVTIFDHGRADDGTFFIAMELLDGVTMLQLLRQELWLAQERAVHIAQQICRSLREAHALGIVHRDLKPANVFLLKQQDEHDFVKVLDFGLLKFFGGQAEADDPTGGLTNPGLFMGTPHYMAPEQARNQPLDQRTDVYALGVLLYQMLTGRVPFVGASSMDVLLQHVQVEPQPLRAHRPDVEPMLEAIVLRCLQKKREDRFETMDHVLAALKAVRKSLTGVDGPPSLPPPGGPNQSGEGLVLATPSQPMKALQMGPQADPAPLMTPANPTPVMLARLSPPPAQAHRQAPKAAPAPSRKEAPVAAKTDAPPSRTSAPAAARVEAPSRTDAGVAAAALFEAVTPPPRKSKVGRAVVAFIAVAAVAAALFFLRPASQAPVAVATKAEPARKAAPSLESKPVQIAATPPAPAAQPVRAAPEPAKKAQEPKPEAAAAQPAKVATPKVDAAEKPAPARTKSERRVARARVEEKKAAPAQPAAALATPAAQPAPSAPVAVAAVAREPANAPVPAAAPAAAPAVAVQAAKPAVRNAPAFVLQRDTGASRPLRLSDMFRQRHRGRGPAVATYRVCVSTEGRIGDVQVVKAIGGDEELIEALRDSWRYKARPQPVCVLMQVPIEIR